LIRACLLASALAAAGSGRLPAQGTRSKPIPPTPKFTVHRAPGPIHVDGRLDDPGWVGAEEIPLAWEISPGDNSPAPVRTLCRVTFDSENLYFGCHAYDPHPGQIRAHRVDRDNVAALAGDDLVGAYIDPFNDQRRAFLFLINPLGVQAEGVKTVANLGEDFSWDAIWASAGRITADGFEVEAAIPFKSLRFPRESAVQTWGFVLVRAWPRNLRYRMEAGPLDRQNTCDICQANKITGFEGISPGRNVEIAPTITAHRTDTRDQFPGGPLAGGKAAADVGGDLRWGVTPNVSLNATVNPDFSQVEADVAQLDVNKRFALFYPEKRPFFLEGADFFTTPIQTVFSRTVADPELGLKLTGKVGGSTNNAIGIFAAEDRLTNLLLPSNQVTDSRPLEESSWSTVGRFRRDLGSASYLGGIYTGRFGTDYSNQVAGVDLYHQLGPSTRINAQYLASWTDYPDTLATEAGQPHGRFRGGAFSLTASYNTGHWTASASYLDLSPNFRADVGFVPRVDVKTVAFNISPVSYRARGWYSVLTAGPYGSETRDHSGTLTDQDLGFGVSYQGFAQSVFNVTLSRHEERYLGVLYRMPRHDGYFDFKPNGALGLTLQWVLGGAIDYANGRQATQVTITPSTHFSVGRGLIVDLSDAYQRLTDHGSKIFRANIVQSKVAYNFSVRMQVRAIVQYRDVDRNPLEYLSTVDRNEKGVLGQFLFSYKVNPQAVLFLGYAENSLGTENYALTKSSRTFFAKIGYGWRP
jgi:hypothetical protein